MTSLAFVERGFENPKDSNPLRRKSPSAIGKDELSEIAKIGSNILKKTVTSSFDVFREVAEHLPKDGHSRSGHDKKSHRKKSDVSAKLPPFDFASSLVSVFVDRLFGVVRDHEFAITVSIRKKEKKEDATTKRS